MENKQPTTHYKSLAREHFDRVVAGTKTYEGRPSEGLSVSVNDFIKFTCGDQSVIVIVTSVETFKDFKEMYDKFGKKLVDVPNRNAAESLYYKFPNYQSRVEKFGATAIGIKVLREM